MGIHEGLDRIEELKPGWLNGTGEVPGPEVLAAAREIESILTPEEAAWIHAFPTVDGHISLESQPHDSRWVLEITPEAEVVGEGPVTYEEAAASFRRFLTSRTTPSDLIRDLDRISSIEPGWMDGSGEAAEPGCVALAREFITTLTPYETALLDVSISVDGFVMFDWLDQDTEARWMMEITSNELVIATLNTPGDYDADDIDQARESFRDFLDEAWRSADIMKRAIADAKHGLI